MKGVSCTQGGHNREQLANMCPAISEDVHNSLMSKNNSNSDAAADCINNNKEDRVPSWILLNIREELGLLGLVGAERVLQPDAFSGDHGALLRIRHLKKEPEWGSQETWVRGLVSPGTLATPGPSEPQFSYL